MQRRAQEDREVQPPGQENEVRFPGPRPFRLLEWKVSIGVSVQIGSVLALGVTIPAAESREQRGPQQEAGRPHRPPERKVKSDRAGVVLELCVKPGQVISAGGVLVRLSGCSHPVVMKGLCAECGQDLTQMQNKNGKQQVPMSTATVSMIHSVPELMVSTEQAELLGREDQQRLHRNRKLVLMVDLDQTLIHTTELHCQHMSRKGIFHFQLGRGEPMLHTRLRPHCKEFLEKIAKLFELHVFTFGSRLYAHTIAGFLDPEKKLFSHRILSRDECIDPFSKTGNLRNLFPCGDSMVCIIDDREDVWKFAPNLITVKKYYQGGGNPAPPLARQRTVTGSRVSCPKSSKVQPSEPPTQPPGQSKDISVEEQSNGLGKATKELNGDPPCSNLLKQESDASDGLQEQDSESSPHTGSKDSTPLPEAQPPIDQGERTIVTKSMLKTGAAKDLDFDLSSDSDSDTEIRKTPSPSSGSENECKRSWRKSKHLDQESAVLQESCKEDLPEKQWTKNHNSAERLTSDAKEKLLTEDDDMEAHSVAQDGLCDLGNGCADKKEIETESQNSEQSGITVGESLDQSMEEYDDDSDDLDEDDHLIYLEEILVRVHTDYYAKYDRFLKKELEEVPDIRKIVPELKSKILENTVIAFSGLHPTNIAIERTREYYHARALGSRISRQLVLNEDEPNRVTHLIAARAGTEKVSKAQNCKHLYVVNPDWLWSCLERWEKVEEQLFPLKEDYLKSQRELSPTSFPDIHATLQIPLYHPTPIHPKSQPCPEVRQYDPVTGKLIRKGSQGSSQSPYIQSPCPSLGLAVHGEHSSFRVVQPNQEQLFVDDDDDDDDEELPTASAEEEQSGPARRKRQPSMSESMPLYTLCKEDLESMDKEVDDILGEGSDDSDSEKKKSAKVKKSQSTKEERSEKTSGSRGESSSSSEQSLTDTTSRGHKRKLDVDEDEEDAEDDRASESSNEEEEGSSSEADEMAAAIEAELNDFI
ncbi:PREDICTED: RNA polymerase II subunit A C-terminal domain phosphatase [Nanorana parkeri]|uniref:RNA polymerase II subunit A C-terminal domain phosphatase n=1 Tax=Nanorana parkeri TaxID=125878 RepID=UPI000854BEC1|nr:PREDICTED: RNA polymerase II subunit A C-terminal domain phosphatase [Nanorana parkeri]